LILILILILKFKEKEEEVLAVIVALSHAAVRDIVIVLLVIAAMLPSGRDSLVTLHGGPLEEGRSPGLLPLSCSLAAYNGTIYVSLSLY